MDDFDTSSAMATVATVSGEVSVSSSGNQLETPPVTAAKKKRNMPGMPDPEAEVIALSPKTLMATNRFVCEICNKGFQRDQNLQLHRRGHNLPWKLRQRTGGEVVRKRVYVCPELTCVHHDPRRALGDLTGVKKHFCRKHGEKKWNCERCLKKYAVKSDWKAHMKTCGTREYRCDCGTSFSRRDSFVTHRAFCDALAQESACRAQNVAMVNSEENLRFQSLQTVAAPSSSSPPPPPLTPSATVLSPNLSIQSSDAVEIPTGILQQPPVVSPGLTSTAASGSTTSSCNGVNSSGDGGVFASMFALSPPPAGLPHLSQSPSSFSDVLCAMAGPERLTEPMPLSLSSSLYLSNHPSSLFPTTRHGHPALSATALLQKAAQLGATGSNSSFLQGLGTQFPYHQGDGTTQWCSRVKTESDAGASGLGLGLPAGGATGLNHLMMGPSSLYVNKPTTLDLLGLGVGGVGGASTAAGFSQLLDVEAVAAAASFGVNLNEHSWDGSYDTKPSDLL